MTKGQILVSGLTLNRRKCEFLAIKCKEDDIARLEGVTQMKRVQTLKHLGLMVNEEGMLPRERNKDHIVDTMKAIAKTLNTVTSTLLGGRYMQNTSLPVSTYTGYKTKTFHMMS